ncbi:Zinc finger FYVE domain-containing protein 9 [Mactra antiquata]
MDSLLVDLDKVLDDFEAEENSVPGKELKPSGYQEYLEQTNQQTWNDLEQATDSYNLYGADYSSEFTPELNNKDVSSLRYDFPYEPEKFDLSEADFAPSPSVNEGAYNGVLNYSPETKMADESTKDSSEKFVLKSNNDSQPLMNGNNFNGNIHAEGSDRNELHFDNQGLPPVKSVVPPAFNKSQTLEGLQGPFDQKIKVPVQADIPMDENSDSLTLQINGHSMESMDSELVDKPVFQTQLSSIPSLSTINSSPEYDKYPVQCNTPQTPKDNPMVNPLAVQLSINGGTIHSDLSKRTNGLENDSDAMQHIPKLQNLKKDLSVNTMLDIKSQNEHNLQEQQLQKCTQSLPAKFLNNSVSGPVTSTGSLPLEFETNTENGEKNPNTYEANYPDNVLSENLSALQNEQIVVANTDDTNMSDQQSQINVLPKETNVSDMVVGFGRNDVDVDDADMDNYLEGEVHPVDLAQNPKVEDVKTTNTDFSGTISAMNNNQVSINAMDVSENPFVQNIHHETNDKEKVPNVQQNENFTNGDSSDLMKASNLPTNVDQVEDSTLEVLKILPGDPSQLKAKSAAPDLSENLSPVANMSLDSGCASMGDNYEETVSQTQLDSGECITDNGARPKDYQNKVNRPSSLMGLSKVNLDSESPFVVKQMVSPIVEHGSEVVAISQDTCMSKPQLIANSADSVMTESRQLMENSNTVDQYADNVTDGNPESRGHLENENDSVELRHPERFQPSEGAVTSRPHSWSPSDSGQQQVQKQKRPTSLNLPPPPTINPNDKQASNDLSPEGDVDTQARGDNAEQNNPEPESDVVTGAEGGERIPDIPPTDDINFDPPPPYCSTLGKVAPKWIPDAEAPICMSCEARFTFTKRRHHCRACGKVFCSTCCSMKNRLPYLKNQEARVCVMCHSELAVAERDAGRHPHPNNPSDYCSVIPPGTQAAGNTVSSQPPSVLVPVLKRDGNVGSDSSSRRSNEPKQVMFSDGIRPGGDLTELDGSSEITRMPPRRSRVQKRVERVSQGQHSPRSRRLRTVTERTTKSLIPDTGLPPLCIPENEVPGNCLQLDPDVNDFMPKIKDENKSPVIFAINTNLYVLVKIVTLDCCVNRTVWCFTTRGMSSVGQEEIVIILECLSEELSPPKDIFLHLNNVFEDASRGNVITEMGHSIFNQSFLDSRDHGGMLYIRATFQCVQKLVLPNPPFLFGILLQKWETPWAKVFPLRLLLRLGAEYRYYPCPLIGIRNRKPVFYEIGHTIMNLLADFRNYQYMLPNIRGVTIHMEDKVTKINFPKNRYEDLMKVVNNSNEHVMAIAATFSSEADSHLVCIQNDDANYQTQAINIQNKPRKVTGASFVVFNGALKTSSGLSAKSSIVEDGLMVQITPDSMLALKQAIRDMHDYPITCGVIGATKPDETVVIQWVEEDKNINIGVKSPVDGMNMDGIESLRIHHATDYVGDKNIMRWTEIFFIQNEERGSPKWDPVDLSRIGETVATACCMALTQHLEKLKESQLERIGLRVTLGADNVGYEAGAKGNRLPDTYMNDLDNELIPVIHRASQPETNIVLELIFEVLE